MIFFAQTAANQSDLVVKEALRAGAENVKATAAGVQFSGSLETGYRFTMTTRIASRVLQALYFDDDISSADKLYESCRDVPWDEYLKPGTTFQVTQTVQACNWLKNSHFAALKLKDAIVDRIKEKTGGSRPDVDKQNSDCTFHLHIKGRNAVIYADFSGEGLYRRGYRSGDNEAVLKEHLASAVLYRSDWYKTVLDGSPAVLLDPFCGLGTIPVEAAQIAADIAPGLTRKEPYAFEKLFNFDEDIYSKVLDELGDKAEAARSRRIRIYASDISRKCIESARAAALKAGVYDYITFAVKDFTKTEEEDVPPGPGFIVTDPPYGVRMKENDCQRLYSRTGEIFQNKFKGWKVSLLCADSNLLSNIDMKPERTNSLYNGGLLCQLAHYCVYTDEEKQALIEKAIRKKEERLSTPLSPGAQMAYNRLVKNIEALKKLSSPHAQVLREGKRQRVESWELVPGDIVILQAGDLVPADLRLLRSVELKTEESALTGESLPAEKAGQLEQELVLFGDPDHGEESARHLLSGMQRHLQQIPEHGEDHAGIEQQNAFHGDGELPASTAFCGEFPELFGH